MNIPDTEDSYYTSFLYLSGELCGIIGQMYNSEFKREKEIASKLAAFNKTITHMMMQADLDRHGLRHELMQEHIKNKILETELKSVYNHYFRHFPAHATEIIKQSHLPTKKELEERVIVKEV